MVNLDLSAFKAKQGLLDARRVRLLEDFIPFRDGMLEELERFITSALQEGIHSVKPIKRNRDSNQLLQVSLTLNDFDLVMVATDEAYELGLPTPAEQLAQQDPVLACKIFLYFDNSDDTAPVIEVIVRESASGANHYEAYGSTTQGPEAFSAGGIVNKEEGRKAAIALLKYLYSFHHYWRDKPTLKMILARRGKDTRPLVFLPLKE